jgi:Flp pilus assembly protein TadD
MFARLLLFAAVVAPVFAQDQDVTKYLQELRAHASPPDNTRFHKEWLLDTMKNLEAATDPKQKAALCMQIARIQNSLSDSDPAIAAAREAHALTPEDRRIAAEFAYLLATNHQNAEASVMLGADAADADALLRRAGQLVEDDVEIAVACIRVAQKLLPDDAATAGALGAIYLRAGRPEDAIRILDRATAKAPDDPLIHLRLAQAFAQIDYREYARAELHAALACHPSSELRAAIEELLAKVTDPK